MPILKSISQKNKQYHSDYSKKYYLQNKETIKAKSKQYRENNKKHKKEIIATYKQLKIKINGRNVNRYILDVNNAIVGIKFKNVIYITQTIFIYTIINFVV
jgi:hypothetical protein